MTTHGRVAALLLINIIVAGSAKAADVPAVVGWSQRVELGTPVSGVVSEVHVRPGQTVSKGDTLISLDDRRFSSQVNRREAAYTHAQAALAEARREDERAVELYDRTVLSDFERNQALLALKAARATAVAAQADLVGARLDLEYSAILAPFDGVILAVNVAPGQTIVSEWQSQPLVTIADNRVYQLNAQIDAAQAERLQPGQSLRATMRGEEMKAQVDHVGFEPVGQPGQGPRYQLVAKIAAGDGKPLRVGETVTLHLPD